MQSCSSCGSDTRPGDRFCATCGTRLEARCTECGTVLPDGARFCPSCGTSTSGPPPAPSTDVRDDAPTSERKTISVVFADLVGFTASSDGADPEDVRSRLQPFHTALREEVERFGGRIEKLMGDGVLAVFGAPTVHEDDPERAVRAGLRIQEAVTRISGQTGMQARVAVGTGEAVVLVEGTTMDREGLVGDVVNTASRLQHEAPPGTVIVDEATHRATHRAFRYEERPPVAVRGKAQPLSVWLAIEPTGRFGVDVDDDGAELVGRSSELGLLVEAFGRAVNDHTSQVVTLAGEPGVGKSRLVRELRRHVDDLPDLVRWRQGRCLPYGEGITYWALGEIVKAEAGILETDTPATALGKLVTSLEPLPLDESDRLWISDRLAPLVGSDPETAVDRSERFAAWHRYLAALGDQRPTVLVIEDLHWADPALVDFLVDLPEATRGIPLLLVGSRAPDFFEAHPTWGGGQRNAVTIRLDPLDSASTRALLDDLLAGIPLEDDVRAAVADRSGGNPLWAQEFVRMLRDRPEGGADAAIPETVQAIVASRIDLLDTRTKTVIQAASTIGKSFWAGAVNAVLDDPSSFDDEFRELTRRELIRRERSSTVEGEVEYAFTHSVVRDVAYAQAPRTVRAERHRSVALWTESMAGDRIADRIEVIAHHHAEARRLADATDHPDLATYVEDSIEAHTRAAAQVQTLDSVAARAHLEAALDLIPAGDPRRAPLLYDLGTVISTLGAADLAIKILLEAREAFWANGDIEGWGSATVGIGLDLWMTAEGEQAIAYLDEAIEALERIPPTRALASAYSHRAGALWLRGDSIPETLAYIDGVRAYIQRHGGDEEKARLLSADGGTRFDAGDASGIEAFREVLRINTATGPLIGMSSAHLNLGEQLATGWGAPESEAVLSRGLEITLARRVFAGVFFLRDALSALRLRQGLWDDALELCEAALDQPDRLPYLESEFHDRIAVIRAGRGDLPSGILNRTASNLETAEAIGDLQAVIPALSSSTWMALMAGDDNQALEYARRVVDRSGATRYLIDDLTLPLWLLRRAGELGRITTLLPDLRRFEMPRPQALLEAVDGLLLEEIDPGGAVATLERAAAALIDMGVPLDGIPALADAARIAEAAGEPARASAIRQRAIEAIAPARATRLLEVLEIA